jgi:hypothetical protein
MRTGNAGCGAVLLGEVVEEPDALPGEWDCRPRWCQGPVRMVGVPVLLDGPRPQGFRAERRAHQVLAQIAPPHCEDERVHQRIDKHGVLNQ